MARMVIGMASGSTERLLVACTVAGGAVALDMDVDIYLLLGGARAFIKDLGDAGAAEIYDHPELKGALRAGMAAAAVAMPLDTLARLKETGHLHVHVCATAGKIWGATQTSAFVGLVDDIVGVAEYVIACEEAEVVQVL